jgi:nickel/cobalt exporter
MQMTHVVLWGSASVALIHTVIGVDHYIPFIALGKAEGWSLRKVLSWTGICGLAHVLSSVLLALVAAGLGWATGRVEWVQQLRGDAAAYLLIGLGSLYVAYDLLFRRRHVHTHVHYDGTVHVHPHGHSEGAEHVHDDTPHALNHRRSLWAMFIIFALGPCEPLVPLVLGAAVEHDIVGLIAVVGLFSLVTVGTMLAMVTVGYLGLGVLRTGPIERFAHALAGLAVVVSGGLILAGL